MSVVITQNLVLDPVETTPDHPLIGYRNLVTSSNITAEFALSGYSASSNLPTPQTNRDWRSDRAGNQHLFLALDGLTPVNYVGIAKHNFGSAQIAVSIESIVGGVTTTVAGPIIPADDSPLLFRFNQVTPTTLRVFMASGTGAPRAAILYAGTLLVMQRRLWVGHTPLPHGRKSDVTSGRSESGQFLGRVQRAAWRESAAPFALITPAWYRSNMDGFLAVAATTPFFFAWRPASYPAEVGYAWLTDDPVPMADDYSHGNLIAFTLNMRGVA